MSKADPIKVSEGDEEEEVLAVLSNLDTALSEIETHLGPLLDKSVSLKELSAQISHLENVKLYAGLAYTLNTLFFSKPPRLCRFNMCGMCALLVYLKTQGVSPATHPVKPELVCNVRIFRERILNVGVCAGEGAALHRKNCERRTETAGTAHKTRQVTTAMPCVLRVVRFCVHFISFLVFLFFVSFRCSQRRGGALCACGVGGRRNERRESKRTNGEKGQKQRQKQRNGKQRNENREQKQRQSQKQKQRQSGERKTTARSRRHRTPKRESENERQTNGQREQKRGE